MIDDAPSAASALSRPFRIIRCRRCSRFYRRFSPVPYLSIDALPTQFVDIDNCYAIRAYRYVASAARTVLLSASGRIRDVAGNFYVGRYQLRVMNDVA